MPAHLPRPAADVGPMLGPIFVPLFIVVVVSGLAVTPSSVHGQIADAFAAAAGGDLPHSAPGASTTGFPSNPAGLTGEDGWAFLITPARVGLSLGPITGRDIARAGGGILSRATRETWLARVGAGDQLGAVDAGVGPIAIRRGAMAFHVSTTVVGRVRLPADAVELLLFGNAGREGVPGDFRLTDSALDGAVFSTAGLAWGVRPAPDDVPELTVGGRLHATLGHGLVVTRDAGSVIDGGRANADLRLPTISSGGGRAIPGFGLGLDLGLRWGRGSGTTGVALINAVRTFEWSDSALRYRAGEMLLEGAGVETDFSPRPLSAAPPSLRALARRVRPARRLELEHVRVVRDGLAVRVTLRETLERGVAPGPPDARLIGVEWAPTPRFDAAGHVGTADGRTRLGAGLRGGFGGWSLAFAWLIERAGERDGSSISISLRRHMAP